jgi:hypothetical protein
MVLIPGYWLLAAGYRLLAGSEKPAAKTLLFSNLKQTFQAPSIVNPPLRVNEERILKIAEFFS